LVLLHFLPVNPLASLAEMSVAFKNKGLFGGVFDKLAVREASGAPSGLARERE
jgi:hypothetical protein